MQLTTTLNKIRQHNPCSNGWKKLLKNLGKTTADDEPLPFGVILDSNGLEDALWCCYTAPEHNRVWRLFAVWCARQVQRLMTDQRSLDALDVAERHANGQATDEELSTAWAAAREAWAATETAARETALAAVLATRDAAGAAGAAARDAESTAAGDAAREAAWEALAAAGDAWAVARKTARKAAWPAAQATAWAAALAVAWAARKIARDTEAATWAAGDAAREAAQTAQAAKFREMVSAVDMVYASDTREREKKCS